jgi:uncharacterized membrane protein YhhN
MSNKTWIGLFIFTLIVHIARISGYLVFIPFVDMITKALLMIILLNWFMGATDDLLSPLKKWITAALCFSWLGDVLLLFQENDQLYFMLGLASFLIAHIFYIVFFHYVRVREKVKGNPWLMVIVVIYYAALITILSPYLEGMKWPVRVYGIVISFMFMLAMHMLFIKNKNEGRWMMVGALLFVISDSVLAINKFYKPFGEAGITVMLTYGLAQLFIVYGAIKYINLHGEKKTED